MIHARVFKVNKEIEWRNWLQYLHTTTDTLETMQLEGVTDEIYIKWDNYCIAISIGECNDIEHPLNERHREMKKLCLENTEKPEILAHFSTKDGGSTV